MFGLSFGEPQFGGERAVIVYVSLLGAGSYAVVLFFSPSTQRILYVLRDARLALLALDNRMTTIPYEGRTTIVKEL